MLDRSRVARVPAPPNELLRRCAGSTSASSGRSSPSSARCLRLYRKRPPRSPTGAARRYGQRRKDVPHPARTNRRRFLLASHRADRTRSAAMARLRAPRDVAFAPSGSWISSLFWRLAPGDVGAGALHVLDRAGHRRIKPAIQSSYELTTTRRPGERLCDAAGEPVVASITPPWSGPYVDVLHRRSRPRSQLPVFAEDPEHTMEAAGLSDPQ